MQEVYDQSPTPEPVDSPKAPLVLLVLLGMSIVGSAVALLAYQGLSLVLGWPSDVLQSGVHPGSPPEVLWPVRVFLLLTQLGTFLLAGWMTTWLFYRKKAPLGNSTGPGWAAYLKADRWPWLPQVLIAMLLMPVAAPLVLRLYQFNQSLPIPENLRGIESQAEDMLKALMQMDTPAAFLFNMLLIAAVPALGEEWVFRGVVQQQLMRVLDGPWKAMLAAAFIFSFIHFQFEGFIPRLFLGALLGWLYWRTQNFWVPVAAHFANNGMQVAGQYLFQQQISEIDLEKDHHIPLFAAAVSLALTLLLTYRLNKISLNTQ